MNRNSLIWEITGNQIETSYLYGTMHIRDQKAFSFMEEATKLIEQCDAFATEIDLSIGLPMLPPDLLFIPDQQSLSDILGDKRYTKLRNSIFKAFALDLDQYQRTLPILTANEIANAILSKDEQLPLDAALSKFAQSKNRIMLGVETIEEHLEVLQKIPVAYQVTGLVKIGKNISRYRQQVLRWAELYEQGRLQQLYLSSKKSLGKMKRILLYDRNIKMAQQIHNMLDQHSLFCAVGAAHLPGQKGVLRLLKRAGYRFRAITK